MKKRKIICVIVLMLIWMLAVLPPSFAKDDVKELKEQIKVLQQRVEQLEGEKKEKMANQSPTKHTYRQQAQQWDPFVEMRRMQEEMGRMFDYSFGQPGFFGGGMLSNNMSFDKGFDVKENDKEYELVFDMTGLDKDRLDIQINQHSITVKGEYSAEKKEGSDNGYYQSHRFGTFIKTIPVPENADTTKVKTEKEEDRLIIKLPKIK